MVPLDREVAKSLRRSGKPVLVAVNKVDTDRGDKGRAEFSELGFDKIFPVSAIHGEGIDNLMDAAVKPLPEGCPGRSGDGQPDAGAGIGTARKSNRPRKPGPLKLAIVGRPNVGQVLHHQCPHPFRTRHRLAHPRHHARRH